MAVVAVKVLDDVFIVAFADQLAMEAYVLSRNQLMQFRATPSNGSLTTYAYNGTVMQQQVFQNGKLVNAKY